MHTIPELPVTLQDNLRLHLHFPRLAVVVVDAPHSSRLVSGPGWSGEREVVG